MHRLLLFLSLFFIHFHNDIFAQSDSLKTDTVNVPEVLNLKENVIQNADALANFYSKMELLKEGKSDRVTILHIGDSHIQGDYFSGTIRMQLQEIFGSAGRGLVFPYSLTKTYSPPDLVASSNISWTTKRNFFKEDSVPLGITGYALVCNNSNFQLRMGVKEIDGQDNSFNRVCVLHGNDSACFDLGIYRNDDASETGVKVMGVIDCWDNSGAKWAQHSIQLDTRVNELVIQPLKNENAQYQSRIYGFVLENSEEKGILYHTAGVGAAQLINFTRTSEFINQAVALKPDLVIFSLGTNESYSNWFDTLAYQNLIENTVDQFRESLPLTAFLFTTPPDIVYKYQHPRYMEPVCRAIQRASVLANFAVWDLNAVMGGPGSMNQWHSNMLAQNDHIHFRSTGYALQGYLFANALMDAYNLNTTTPVSTESLSEYINRNAPVYYKPAVVAATVSTGSKYHIVKSGETLSGIARKYGTSVSKICTLSGIKKSRVIRPGQRLRVR